MYFVLLKSIKLLCRPLVRFYRIFQGLRLFQGLRQFRTLEYAKEYKAQKITFIEL
jgi:hypothetical protein